jgi:hypothetical protein
MALSEAEIMKTIIFVLLFSPGNSSQVVNTYEREADCRADRRHLIFEAQKYPDNLKCVAIEK